MHANTQAPAPPAKKGGLKFKLFWEHWIHMSMPLIINTVLCCPWDIGPQKNIPYFPKHNTIFPSHPTLWQIKSQGHKQRCDMLKHISLWCTKFVIFFIFAQHQFMSKHYSPSILLCRWWCPFDFITMIVIYFLLSKFLWSPRSWTITLCTEKKYFLCGSKACSKWANKMKAAVQVDHTFTNRKKGRNVGAV